MKFPVTERLVPHLTLSDAERRHYSKMGGALVDDMVAQYVEFDQVYHRQVNREQWKAVKKREGLTVYKERKIARPKVMRNLQATSRAPQAAHDHRLSSDPRQPFASTTKWVVPTLLMVGSIVGTLDDVMYGVTTFDAPSMLLKTTYTHDELLDGEVLSQIQGPSRDDPFQFLGIKWLVKGNPAAVSKLVRPRDLVFLEATGLRVSEDGERYGYHLMHSLDLPGFGPLADATGILRGRVSSCLVFKQRADGTSVDVYMKANFEPNGSVGEAVAVLSAANGLIYCWRSVFCAQHKKLTHLLAARAREAAIDPAGRPTTSTHDKGSACRTCGKPERAYRQLLPCALCSGAMCSSCRVDKKISYAASSDRQSKQIHRRVIPFCKACVSSASRASALAIAREEVSTGKWSGCARADEMPTAASLFGRWQSQDVALSAGTFSDSTVSDSGDIESAQLQQLYDSNRSGVSVVSDRGATSSARSSRQHLPRSVSSVSSARSSICAADIDDNAFDPSASNLPRVWPRSVSHVLLEQQELDTSVPKAFDSTRSAPIAPPPPPLGSQAELYQRIAQLRETAESVYQIAMTNSAAMHAGQSSSATSIRIAP